MKKNIQVLILLIMFILAIIFNPIGFYDSVFSVLIGILSAALFYFLLQVYTKRNKAEYYYKYFLLEISKEVLEPNEKAFIKEQKIKSISKTIPLKSLKK
jgi:positive regulator of sigma E activity